MLLTWSTARWLAGWLPMRAGRLLIPRAVSLLAGGFLPISFDWFRHHPLLDGKANCFSRKGAVGLQHSGRAGGGYQSRG